MTEIKIENKKIPWPWILAFVLLGLHSFKMQLSSF
jgi:hypothetical protein